MTVFQTTIELISNEIELHSQIVTLTGLHLCEDIDIGFWSNQEIDVNAQRCELKSHPGLFFFLIVYLSFIAARSHKWKSCTKKCSM